MRIIQALVLLLQIGWTAMVAEQAHASVSLIRRYHAEYGMLMLVIRAMIHQLYRFIFKEKRSLRDRLADKIERLVAQRPERASGFGMHLRLLHQARARTMGDPVDSFAGGISMMKFAAESWRQLDPEERRGEYYRSREHSGEVRAEIEAKIDEAYLLIKELQDEEACTLQEMGTFRSTSGCVWTQAAFERFEELWDGDEWKPERVTRYMNRHLTKPEAVDPKKGSGT